MNAKTICAVIGIICAALSLAFLKDVLGPIAIVLIGVSVLIPPQQA